MTPTNAAAGLQTARPKIERVSDLVLLAGALPPKSVIIAGGDRPEDIRLVESARDHGIVDRCVLVGDRERIAEAADQVRVKLRDEDIVGTAGDEETAARVVEGIQAGRADIVLKGNISTPALNRAMLRLVVRPTISLVTMFDAAPLAGGRPMLLTDPGVTTVCNLGRMVGLIENAVDVARAILGIDRPRVALLSANEKVIDSLPSTKMAEALTRRAWPDAVVYGPLSLDLAVSADSVRLKSFPPGGPAGEVAGRADILVCPGLDAANILYKAIMEMVQYGLGTFAGITVGVSVPYVILSRADNLEAKLQSIALARLAAESLPAARRAGAPAAAPAVRKDYRIFIVNPGASSTKLAVYEGAKPVTEAEVLHGAPESGEAGARAEARRRGEEVERFIASHEIGRLDAVVGRGGFLPRPPGKLAGGTYVVAEVRDGRAIVDDAIVRAVVERPERRHPSNLGIPLAADLAVRFGVPAFVVDPVVVDEFAPAAELSGYAGIPRLSVGHILSVHGSARQVAEKAGLPLEQTRFVVAHLGSGFTIAAVVGGRIVDSNIALLGEGPFSPQRAGTLPLREFIDLCYSGRFATKEALYEELTVRGGLRSYLGEHRMDVIEKRIQDGDAQAKRVAEAMIYQLAKSIGSMAVAAGPDVDGIILTGGLTRSEMVVRGLKARVSHLAPITILERTPEMDRMVQGACAALSGAEPPLRYVPPPAT
jgi:butyrate kinase